MYRKGDKIYRADRVCVQTLTVARDADLFAERVMVRSEGGGYLWPLDARQVDTGEGGLFFTDIGDAYECHVQGLNKHVKALARDLGVKTQQLNNVREVLLAMKGA